MPAKIKDLYAQILAHPEYKTALDESTRFAFEHGCVAGGSWRDKENHAWARKLWRKLNGVPEPEKKRKDTADQPGAKRVAARKMPHVIYDVQEDIRAFPGYPETLTDLQRFVMKEIDQGIYPHKYEPETSRRIWHELYEPAAIAKESDASTAAAKESDASTAAKESDASAVAK